MNDDSRAAVRAYVQDLLRDSGGSDALQDDDAMFTGGRLSSFQMLQLIMFLEARFGLDFDATEFDVALLDSVNAIMALVQRPRD